MATLAENRTLPNAAGQVPPVPLDGALVVRPLSVVPEGEEFLVGDPERAEYVLLPAVGVQVIRLLQGGRTVGAVAAEIGAAVDVPDFIVTLLQLGFASPPTAGPAGPTARAAWRVPRFLVRPLFGRVAWASYAACAAVAATLLTWRSDLVPRVDDIFFLPSPLASIAGVTLLMYLRASLHEAYHWAAARAEGLDARITISRRLYVLALETDLTRLWSLPRRRRLGPLLAGMASDAVVLCGALVARLGDADSWWHLASGLAPLLAALAFVAFAGLIAQCYVFARTDLYAVLVAATGCVNLWRVNQLHLLARLRQLRPDERQELAEAHPQDLAVARWFAWVYVTGLALAAGFFLVYYVPATVRLVGWLVSTVAAAQVATLEFWAALLFAGVVLSPHALTLVVIIRELSQRLSAARRT